MRKYTKEDADRMQYAQERIEELEHSIETLAMVIEDLREENTGLRNKIKCVEQFVNQYENMGGEHEK